jgi:hypothetical protein
MRLLTLCLQDCIYHEEDDDEEDDVAHCVSLWNEIICGLSNNQPVKFVSLDSEYVIDSLRRKRFSTIEKIRLSGHGDVKFRPLHTFGHMMPNLKSL